MEGGVYDTNNKMKRATFKYEQEGRFCLGVTKVEKRVLKKNREALSGVLSYRKVNCHHV